uniref:Ribosomal protein S4 n=1 Tax=Percursaria percursa TaxID=153906 RepID=A0A8K1N1B3_9CHLO|nr:ribosomal protein S4 [Percursaria percursa]
MNIKKLKNTKIINHLHRLTPLLFSEQQKVSKVAVGNTKQLTLILGKTTLFLEKAKCVGVRVQLAGSGSGSGFLSRLLLAPLLLHLQKNNTLIKVSLLNILKGSTSTTGFKKMLYNRIKIQNNRLYPSYNRRKHNHSHHILITNQLSKLSKTFDHLSKNKLKNFITLALKKALGKELLPSSLASFVKPHTVTVTKGDQVLKLMFGIRTRAIPNLISILETQTEPLLWRNQFKHCLAYSRQTLLHGNVQILLKK